MNRVDAMARGQSDDRFDIKVRSNRLARLSDQVRFVRLKSMQRVAIFVGVDGDGADAQLMRRTEHPDGNFAAVGHQQLTNRLHERLLSSRSECKSCRVLSSVQR